MKKWLFSIVFALSAGGLVGCGEEEIPVHPTDDQVKGIVLARCVRCHGGGGTLNDDPESPPLEGSDKEVPSNGYFTMLDNAGAQHGLRFYGPSMSTWLNLPMPPPPAAQLTDREREILIRWGKDQAQ